jgi:hypothetical protein
MDAITEGLIIFACIIIPVQLGLVIFLLKDKP